MLEISAAMNLFRLTIWSLILLQLSNLLLCCYLSPTVVNYVSNVVSTVIPVIDASMVNIVLLSDRWSLMIDRSAR
jgi:hypothetical protein